MLALCNHSLVYRVDTNSINPVSQGRLTGQKPCIHAGLSRFDGHSHSLNPEKPKALQYQGFWLFLFLLFRIMFRRIEAFLKFPKTNRNQVKLFFFVNPCSLTFALGAEGWRLCVVALQTMISKSELKRLKVGMPLKGSKMPYNRFYTRLRVERYHLRAKHLLKRL